MRKMQPDELLKKFNEKYSYVCIDYTTCKEFMNIMPESLWTEDNLYDWVISQDKAEEVVE